MIKAMSTQSKKLLSCPNCEESGKKVILAEIDGEDIVIKRFRGYKTRISGSNLRVHCDECKEIIYVKQYPLKEPLW